jgi:hypothetical protein
MYLTRFEIKLYEENVNRGLYEWFWILKSLFFDGRSMSSCERFDIYSMFFFFFFLRIIQWKSGTILFWSHQNNDLFPYIFTTCLNTNYICYNHSFFHILFIFLSTHTDFWSPENILTSRVWLKIWFRCVLCLKTKLLTAKI